MPVAALCRRLGAQPGDGQYVMLDGVNDSVVQARELVKLLADVPAKVNLIPFNPFPDTRFTRSSQERQSIVSRCHDERGPPDHHAQDAWGHY